MSNANRLAIRFHEDFVAGMNLRLRENMMLGKQVDALFQSFIGEYTFFPVAIVCRRYRWSSAIVPQRVKHLCILQGIGQTHKTLLRWRKSLSKQD